MGGIDTPAAENNNRIIRKLCSLSDYWGRRKFLKERGLHGDRLNIYWAWCAFVISSLSRLPTASQ